MDLVDYVAACSAMHELMAPLSLGPCSSRIAAFHNHESATLSSVCLRSDEY